MTLAQAKRLEAFWDQVRKAKQVIRDNGHRPPPIDAEDQRNWELEDAYDAIHPLLVSLYQPRLFNAVSALPQRQGPFTADNAHQALSFVLNPPEAMFGNPTLLEHSDFVQINQAAEKEASILAAMEAIPVAVPILPKIGAEALDPDYEPAWAIQTPERKETLRPESQSPESLSHLLSETKHAIVDAADFVKPLSAKELARLVGCKERTVHKYAGELIAFKLIKRVAQGYVRVRP